MRQWIEDWPWTKTFIAVGVIHFALIIAITGIVMAVVSLVPELQPDKEHEWFVREIRNTVESMLQWSVLAATGGAIGIVGKRATTKPEVVDAESRATTKIMQAAPTPGVTTVREPDKGTTIVTKTTPLTNAQGRPLPAQPAPVDTLSEEGL